MSQLLDDDELARSPVVANCRMNRGRGLDGSNGYAVEVGFAPLDFLRDRAAAGRAVAWLDLCCGSGRALIEAARAVRDEGWPAPAAIVGVDLVGMSRPVEPGLIGPALVEASLSTWRPDRAFDLITCVHGLHYIGDKLDLIERAASWLTAEGRFVGSLDLGNLRLGTGREARRHFAARFRRAGLILDSRRRLVRLEGRRLFHLPYRYLGADADAGPNYSGQLAVNSFYEVSESSPAP